MALIEASTQKADEKNRIKTKAFLTALSSAMQFLSYARLRAYSAQLSLIICAFPPKPVHFWLVKVSPYSFNWPR